jgi:beta-1,4-mannooligosaccharide/beta-1,4-mannosyl-N-acetylglucosamine phosphorylase
MTQSRTADVLCRHPANPILSAKDVPYKATLVFNAGVCKFHGKYVMMFRNDVHDYPNVGTAPIVWDKVRVSMGLAMSDDGIHWTVSPKPCLELRNQEIIHCYDPRLTVLEGRVYLCFAVDTRHGIRGGIAVTDDFEKFDILHMTVPDNRNMVLFPERIGGLYVRLERPFPVYGRQGKDRFDIWLSRSPDLRYWGDSDLVLGVEHVTFPSRSTVAANCFIAADTPSWHTGTRSRSSSAAPMSAAISATSSMRHCRYRTRS